MAGGGITRAAYAFASRAHVSVGPLLKRANLSVQQIKNPRLRIPVKDQIKFLNLVADKLRDEFLGIRLAQTLNLRELGLLYYVMASSDTLGDALRRGARYSTIQNEGVQIDYRGGKVVTVTFNYIGVARQPDRHQIEIFITILLRVCQELSGLALAPLRGNLCTIARACRPRSSVCSASMLRLPVMPTRWCIRVPSRLRPPPMPIRI